MLDSLEPAAVLKTTSCPSTRKFTGRMTTSPPARKPIHPTGTDPSSPKQSPRCKISSPARSVASFRIVSSRSAQSGSSSIRRHTFTVQDHRPAFGAHPGRVVRGTALGCHSLDVTADQAWYISNGHLPGSPQGQDLVVAAHEAYRHEDHGEG